MMQVLRVDRACFLADYWPGLYQPGQHVAAFGPTQRAGKTHLLWQLLQATGNAQLRRVVTCMKPIDPTTAAWTRTLGYREVASWPPTRWPWQERPPGFTLWPRHTHDPDVDDPHIRAEFRKAILDNYKKGRCILLLDEISGLCGELDLTRELQTVLTKGGGGKCAAWIATQKPSGTRQAPMPGYVFNSPYHFFLAPDNVKANRDKYADIAGGIDPDLITSTTLGLSRFEFLYINADGEMAIVGA